MEILKSFLASEPLLVGEYLIIADICVAETVAFFQEIDEKYMNELRQLIENTLEKN